MRTPLADDELLITEGRRHWITLALPVIILSVSSVIILAVNASPWSGIIKILGAGFLLLVMFYTLIQFASLALDRRFSMWILTDRRVIREWGVISRHFQETPLEDIVNVNFDQSWFGRKLDYATVEVTTANVSEDNWFAALASPQEFIDALDEARRAIKQGGKDMKKCPHCAELVKSEARACRYCGRDI